MQIKPLLVLILLLFVFGGGYYLTRPYFVDEEKIGCTLDAKICPDGSSVGRTGPNCEFTRCPEARSTTQSFSGKCMPKFEVVSGPELTASENYSMECKSKTSQSDCERVDIYHEANGNFGNADGIHDCKWVEESSPIDTSNWKTYRNEKYGFEVKYPPYWTVDDGRLALETPLIVIYDNRDNEIYLDLSFQEETGDIKLDCPFGIHEIECKKLRNDNGIEYIREIVTGQLRWSNQQELNAYFVSPEVSIQVSTQLTDISGKPLPDKDFNVAVFDQIVARLQLIN